MQLRKPAMDTGKAVCEVRTASKVLGVAEGNSWRLLLERCGSRDKKQVQCRQNNTQMGISEPEAWGSPLVAAARSGQILSENRVQG